MNEWLKSFQSMEKPEQAIRAVVIGGTALLLLMATVDVISGKRDQAVAVTPRVESTTSDVVATTEAGAPADEAVDDAALAEAEAAEEAPDAADEPALAEADAMDEALEEMATEAAPEAADEPALAEADAVDEAPEEIATEAAPESADEPALAEADAVDEAPEEIATEAAPEAADEPALAEAMEEAPEDSSVSALLASADPDNGQRVFRQCAACHVYNAEQNRGGPHLVNIVGREVGVVDGWRYSRALSEHGGVWTVESLLAWLENPDSYIPGNQMAFRGLRNEQDRIDVLGFLEANRAD